MRLLFSCRTLPLHRSLKQNNRSAWPRLRLVGTLLVLWAISCRSEEREDVSSVRANLARLHYWVSLPLKQNETQTRVAPSTAIVLATRSEWVYIGGECTLDKRQPQIYYLLILTRWCVCIAVRQLNLGTITLSFFLNWYSRKTVETDSFFSLIFIISKYRHENCQCTQLHAADGRINSVPFPSAEVVPQRTCFLSWIVRCEKKNSTPELDLRYVTY